MTVTPQTINYAMPILRSRKSLVFTSFLRLEIPREGTMHRERVVKGVMVRVGLLLVAAIYPLVMSYGIQAPQMIRATR